jgi:hypothetical protein
MFMGAQSLHDARALMRREMAVLNTVPGQLKPDLSSQDRKNLENGIRKVKLALMKSFWDSGEWGAAADFEEWINSGEPMPPPNGLTTAVEYFRYGEKGN